MIRAATPADVPALTVLIERSARELSRGFYTDRETESAITHVFGVDSSLVADGTYFIVESAGTFAACGGWSRRRTLYGGDQRPVDASDGASIRTSVGAAVGAAAELLDPAVDAARIRAFFVAPEFARKGIGRLLLTHCSAAAVAAGFTSLELMATLPGVPFYAALGFREVEAVRDLLPDGVALPFVRMVRRLDDTTFESDATGAHA